MEDEPEQPFIRPGSHTAADEVISLDLVRAVQCELAQCLNSLGGKPVDGALDKFVGFSSRHMNNAIESYLLLRERNRIDASKLLIRPIIEFWFRLTAVLESPEVFYRIIFSEREKRSKWLRAIERRGGEKFDEAAEQKAWEVFRQHCISVIPDCDVDDHSISAEIIATSAGLHKYYDTHYRLYCMFTHGHLEAVIGGFDPLTDSEDNLIVALCGMGAMAVLMSIGGASDNFDELSERLIRLSQPR